MRSLTYAGFVGDAELWSETVDGKRVVHRLLPAPMPEWPEPVKDALRHRRNTALHGSCRCGRKADEFGHLWHDDRCPAGDQSIYAALEAIQQVDPTSYMAWVAGASAGREQPIPGE